MFAVETARNFKRRRAAQALDNGGAPRIVGRSFALHGALTRRPTPRRHFFLRALPHSKSRQREPSRQGHIGGARKATFEANPYGLKPRFSDLPARLRRRGDAAARSALGQALLSRQSGRGRWGQADARLCRSGRACWPPPHPLSSRVFLPAGEQSATNAVPGHQNLHRH